MLFSVILILLVVYELFAIHTNKVPTITEILRGIPLWISILVIIVAVLALVDHVYYQWVMP